VVINDLNDVDLFSDVNELSVHPEPEWFDDRLVYPFPLEGKGDNSYLCTQGVNGAFTHFYCQTYHAIDFACNVGTSVVSVGDGEVVEVKDENSVGGIHVRNLFLWNSMIIKMDDGIFVEYVHIRNRSALVKVGDRVVQGQKICESGDVGFCPQPHLHIQMHTSKEKNAPTVKFALKDIDGNKYFPEAGKYYSKQGQKS